MRLIHMTKVAGILVALGAATGCATPRFPSHPPNVLPAPVAAAPVAERPTTSLTAVATGSAALSGSVRGDAFEAAQSAGADAPLRVSGARSGDEGGYSNRAFTTSTAAASASFDAVHLPDRGIFGCTIVAATSGRGGHYHNVSVWPPRVDIGDSTGAARATATCAMRIEHRGGPDDQLLVAVVGKPSAMTLHDAAGAAIPLTTLGDGTYAARMSSGPGTYLLSAQAEARASGSGGCEGCLDRKSTTVTVSVQSVRDALRFGYATGTPGATDQSWVVPLFVSASDLERVLREHVFTDDGKYYPCRGSGNCDAGSDLYLEWPSISVSNGWIVLKVHLSGHGRFLFLRPGITGDVYATARPVIEDGVLKLEGLHLDVQSANVITKVLDARGRAAIEATLQAKAHFPLQAKLDEVRAKLGPIATNGVCLLLDVTGARVSSIEARSDPAGIMARLELGVRFSSNPAECRSAADRKIVAGK